MPTSQICDVYTPKNGVPGPEVALELCFALGNSRVGRIRVDEQTIDLPGIGERRCVHLRAPVLCEPDNLQQSSDLVLSLVFLADTLASQNGEPVFAHFPGHPKDELIWFRPTAGQATS